MSEESSLTRVTRKGQITVPAAVHRAPGIEHGDLVAVTIEGDTISLVPKRLVDKSRAYFWGEARQQAEREASQDLADARVPAFDDVEDLIRALEAGEA